MEPPGSGPPLEPVHGTHAGAVATPAAPATWYAARDATADGATIDDEEEATVGRSRATRTVERRPATDGRPELELVRSTRRRRSASAQARDGRLVVQLPAGLPAAEEERLIAGLVTKVTDRLRSRVLDDDGLLARASDLADRYVDGVRPVSVSWSSRMAKRYGSCSYAAGTIRISNRLAGAPDYVIDSVLVHELAHLVEHDHGPAFKRIVARYPHEERARAFLAGLEFAEQRGVLPPPGPPAEADL